VAGQGFNGFGSPLAEGVPPEFYIIFWPGVSIDPPVGTPLRDGTGGALALASLKEAAPLFDKNPPGTVVKFLASGKERVEDCAMEYEELCVAKSFSLKRNLIAGIRLRARYLKMPMSAYVAALIHNDLVRGIEAPLTRIPAEVPIKIDAHKSTKPPPSPRGVVVDFDLWDV